jgi:hypothetical protein
MLFSIYLLSNEDYTARGNYLTGLKNFPNRSGVVGKAMNERFSCDGYLQEKPSGIV